MVGFTYPVLHTGSKWYVDFYALDPSRNEMRRKKFFISSDLKISQRKRKAAEIMEAVTKQLMTGLAGTPGFEVMRAVASFPSRKVLASTLNMSRGWTGQRIVPATARV